MTDAALPQKRYATAADYLNLMKPRIMMLVVFTGFAGLVAASNRMTPGPGATTRRMAAVPGSRSSNPASACN